MDMELSQPLRDFNDLISEIMKKTGGEESQSVLQPLESCPSSCIAR